MPEHLQRKGLTIMHVTLARIVPQDTIHHDLLLSLVEPAVLATEFGRRLRWGWWQVEVRYDTNTACQRAFQREQPSPAFQATNTCHVKDAESHECRDDGGRLIRHPEERQPDRKFVACVPVGEIQDVVRNESAFDHT